MTEQTGQRTTVSTTENTGMSLVNRVVRFKEQDWVRRTMCALPIWITPNCVTAFRAVLMIPVMILVLSQSYWWALVLFAFSVLLDFADGALAEARDLKTRCGAFLDPLMDKITVWMLLGVLAPMIPFGWWLFGVVVVTGGLLTGLRVKKMLRREDVDVDTDGHSDIKARPAGKIKLIAEVVSLSAVLLGLALSSLTLMRVGSGLMLVAAVLGLLSLRSHLVKEG